MLRVPAAMRAWVLPVVQEGRLSLEEAAGLLRTDAAALAQQLGAPRPGVTSRHLRTGLDSA